MNQTVSITDQRTQRTQVLPITDGTIHSAGLRELKLDTNDAGLATYDPGLSNTVVCRSSVTFVDGVRGTFLYRGYPVSELAQKCSFAEVTGLLLNGELPTASELSDLQRQLVAHSQPPEHLRAIANAFPTNGHPVNLLMALVAALGANRPDARQVRDAAVRRHHMLELIAQMPTLGAWCHCRSRGEPLVDPQPELGYSGSFLAVLKNAGATNFRPHPELVRAMDLLFILHADHEQNCSTSVMRSIGSTLADPYLAVTGSIAALAGPLHGGANEAVLKMLREIGSTANIREFVANVKSGKAGRLMGFGHRVYKNYDPRAKVIKAVADRVFDMLGTKSPLVQIALELEKIGLNDDYFVSRKLYPNVDFYSGLIYEALGIAPEMFPVLFAIPRTVGWLVQWEELLLDPEQRIARPRQIYTGKAERPLERPQPTAAVVQAAADNRAYETP